MLSWEVAWSSAISYQLFQTRAWAVFFSRANLPLSDTAVAQALLGVLRWPRASPPSWGNYLHSHSSAQHLPLHQAIVLINECPMAEKVVLPIKSHRIRTEGGRKREWEERGALFQPRMCYSLYTTQVVKFTVHQLHAPHKIDSLIQRKHVLVSSFKKK